MCIRDRAYQQSEEQRAGKPGSDAATGTFVFEAVGVGTTTCLLYTSDAADERSSVDLGGRRIIKKKKHRVHERARDSMKRSTHTTSYGV